MTNGDRWMTFGMFTVALVAFIAAMVVWKEYDQPPPVFPKVTMGPEAPAVMPSPIVVAQAPKIQEQAPVDDPCNGPGRYQKMAEQDRSGQGTGNACATDAPSLPQPDPRKGERYPVRIDVQMHREPAQRHAAHRKPVNKERKLKRDWERAQSNFPQLFNLR